MKLTLKIEHQPIEHTTHLREGLVCLLNRLGLVPTIIVGNGASEWIEIQVEAPAPIEPIVDEVLPKKFTPFIK